MHEPSQTVTPLKNLAIQTILVSPSGALSPGPLSASAIAVGAALGPLGGVAVALGHTIAELPYVALLYKGVSTMKPVLEKHAAKLNTMVSLFLAFFAYLLLRDSYNLAANPPATATTSLLGATGYTAAVAAGITLTIANIYFLLWWLSVGYPLIRQAAEQGPRGLTIMYTSHVWMDYAWLTLLATGGGAASLLGPKPYAALLALLALILLYYAAKFLADAAKHAIHRTTKI